MELRSSNNDILENQNGTECVNDSEVFKKHYATVLVELKEASGQACGFQWIISFITTFCILKQILICCNLQVSDAMLQLRQRNTYRGNSLPPWMKPQTSLDVHDDLPNMLDASLTQELGSTVVQIIKGSRSRAHAMVDAAFKVCFCIYYYELYIEWFLYMFSPLYF